MTCRPPDDNQSKSVAELVGRVLMLSDVFCMCLNAAFHYDANYLGFSCFSTSFSQTCYCTFALKHNCRQLPVICPLAKRVWRECSWQVSLHSSFLETEMNYPHQGHRGIETYITIFTLAPCYFPDLCRLAGSLSLRKGKCFR